MKRKDILDALTEFLLHSNVDQESKLFQQALDAIIAINLNEIEE